LGHYLEPFRARPPSCRRRRDPGGACSAQTSRVVCLWGSRSRGEGITTVATTPPRPRASNLVSPSQISAAWHVPGPGRGAAHLSRRSGRALFAPPAPAPPPPPPRCVGRETRGLGRGGGGGGGEEARKLKKAPSPLFRLGPPVFSSCTPASNTQYQSAVARIRNAQCHIPIPIPGARRRPSH
jgi:hypothetical protein